MAYLNINEFQDVIFRESINWKFGQIPILIKLTLSSIKIRIYLTSNSFIDSFFNETTGHTSFALIKDNQRILGINNTGNSWHIHPFDNPAIHKPIRQEVDYKKFLKVIENLIKENKI